MSQQQSVEELRAEVERLTTMCDRLLATVNEQGAARAKDYDTMRGMLAELVWRRKEMGDPPHGQHDFQRPGSGLERQCVRCQIRYSAWFGDTSCPDEEPGARVTMDNSTATFTPTRPLQPHYPDEEPST